MATLSSAGLGSGLDVSTIVTKLVALERAPIDRLATEQKALDAQVSTFGKLQSALSSLRDAASKLTKADAWSPATTTSSDAASVSATAGSGAVPGNYAITVAKLARSQLLTSSTFATAATAVGTGTLTIELGTWASGQTAFTADASASAVSISIGAGEDSLTAIRDKINAAGAGVTASIVNDATGARLALRSNDTGEAHAFRVTAVDDDGDSGDAGGLSQLAFDPSAGIGQMAQKQGAANAEATINGIDIVSQSNTLTNVLDGLTVSLSRETTGSVNVGVQRDTETIKKTLTAFATAYNDVVTMLRTQTNYDEASKSGGALQGDRTALGLLGRLRGLAQGTSNASSVFTRLNDIGLSPQRDGTLKVDDSKLGAAIANVGELKKMFASSDDDAALDGFGTVFREFGDQVLGSDGAIESRQETLRRRKELNTTRQEHLEDRVALFEARLRAQYTRLDQSMANLTSLQNYVSQQVTNWNKNTG